MSLSEAKKGAEKEGTDKSAKFRRTARNAIIAITIIVVLTIITCVGSSHIKSGPQKQSGVEKQVFTMPAGVGEKTELIPVPTGMRVKMDGNDFRYNCVYRDGHEVSFGKGDDPCPDGDMPFVYASNTRKKEANAISISYVKP